MQIITKFYSIKLEFYTAKDNVTVTRQEKFDICIIQFYVEQASARSAEGQKAVEDKVQLAEENTGTTEAAERSLRMKRINKKYAKPQKKTQILIHH